MDDLVAIRKGMRLPDGSRVRFRTIKRDGTTGDRAYDHVEAMRNGKNIGYITLGARGEKAVRKSTSAGTAGVFGKMSASLVDIGKAHQALVRLLGDGLAVRGTTDAGIKRMARGEMPYRLNGTFGPGVYTTNTVREAAEYREGVKGARLAVFKPSGKPRKTYRSERWNEDTWLPEDLGKPVHVQNINRSTAMRLRRQEMGLPRPDHRLKPMTPVSELTPKERADRLYQARYRRKWRGVEGFRLPEESRAPWNRQ